jgi:hypothetical protein
MRASLVASWRVVVQHACLGPGAVRGLARCLYAGGSLGRLGLVLNTDRSFIAEHSLYIEHAAWLA